MTKIVFMGTTIADWQAAGKKVVIVHGGGHYISEMMEKMALTVTIKDGLRVTISKENQ